MPVDYIKRRILIINVFYFFFLIYVFIYLFLSVLGLRFCARAFSSCGKWRPLFIAVRGPLTIAASLVAEHRLQTRRLSNCSSRAQPLCGMWDPPRPGLEPVSPAPAGRLPATAPPGKPLSYLCLWFTVKLLFTFPQAWLLILEWKFNKLLVHFSTAADRFSRQLPCYQDS